MSRQMLTPDVLEQRRRESLALESERLAALADAPDTYQADLEAEASEYEQERRELLASMCEHMRALVEHCISVGVEFGGCGDCGSAWLYCRKCKLQVDKAHDAFEPGPYEAD